VLQEGEYTTVGGRTPISTDVRIVAATHQDLAGLIDRGQFREDLYYRLNVVPLRLPPLRERGQDVPDLARHFLEQVEARGLPRKVFDKSALDRMKQHNWPGNVRELENLVQRLVALYPQEKITSELVESELSAARPSGNSGDTGAITEQQLQASVSAFTAQLLEENEDGEPLDNLYSTVLREIEEPLINMTLRATRGNQIKAAKVLGLNRNTLRKKIKDLDLQVMRGIS
jgi:two-component system nitrogen regulation response regulator GlnG